MIYKGIYKQIIGILLILLCGCTVFSEKDVTITKDYVINPNWNEQDNSFDVVRMMLKDTINYINPKTTDYIVLSNKLTKDENFSYGANVKYDGTDYAQRKVYFNKDNGFLWWEDFHDSKSTKKVLGELEKETWYLLGGLSSKGSLYYVYIDSLDKIYRFKKLTSNW